MDNIKEVLDKVDEKNCIVDKYEYITKNVIPKQKDMFSIENIMCNNTLLCDVCTHNPKNGGDCSLVTTSRCGYLKDITPTHMVVITKVAMLNLN